jgi:hypothetical protein
MDKVDKVENLQMTRTMSEQHQVCWRCNSFIPAGDEHVIIKTNVMEERACLPCFDNLKESLG